MADDKAVQIDLPPWPYIDQGPAKIQVSEGRFLFGRRVGDHVLTPKGRVIRGVPIQKKG